jgi:hypothetical protein
MNFREAGDIRVLKANRAKNPHLILSKPQGYGLYRQGVFGNRAYAWDNIKDLYDSKWPGAICIRDRRGTQRGECNAPLPLFNIPIKDLEVVVGGLVKKGVPLDVMTFNQSMPDSHLTIQGEASRFFDGQLHLTYSTVKKPMNQALAEETLRAEGLSVDLILKDFLSPASYVEVMENIEYFSHSPQGIFPVVEFSAYSVGVGDLPGRNAVIWEVRSF